ncbi:MAG: molybdopterin-binding protein [Xanthobacteraceae bacterium]
MVEPAEPHQRVTRLTPLDAALAAVDALAQPVSPRALRVETALGRVLAADVTIAQAAPHCPLALRDGWAVSSDLVADAGPYAPVLLRPAPEWVEAGWSLPAGTDAVMPPDAVAIGAGIAEAVAPVVAGEGVLAAGADGGPGAPLRHAGQAVRAVDIAAFGALGVIEVMARLPRVRLVAASVRHDADGSRIPLFRRAIEADGGAVCGRPREPDDDLLEDHLLAEALAADGADAVIVVGGVGMGCREFAVETLARVGAVAIHGVGLRPGADAAIGSVGARPVLLLPGRHDAALAVYLLVGRRLLARLTGGAEAPAGRAVLARKIVSTVGMAELVLVRRGPQGIEPIAAEHFPLQAITQADGYVVVPGTSEGYASGSVVEMRPLP